MGFAALNNSAAVLVTAQSWPEMAFLSGNCWVDFRTLSKMRSWAGDFDRYTASGSIMDGDWNLKPTALIF